MKNPVLSLTLVLIINIHSYVSATPSFKWIRHNSDTLGLYEKFEISFLLDTEFDNPFDPDDIDVMATFTAPSGKTWKIPGFYSSVPRASWVFNFAWYVRFSADESGVWRYVIDVRDRNGKVSSESRIFTVVESKCHGPIKISSSKRYLEHDDGTPYYGIGLWVLNQENAEVIDELKNVGVNFVGYVMTPIESWASGLGRYDQELCRNVDKMLELLEERDMQLALSFWMHSFLSETIWGGGNIAWHTSPYALVTECKDFYGSEEAWKYQEKLYRYMIARWGYSPSLAVWYIVHEVNGTDGWVHGDTLLANQWANKVHDYLKIHDPWQHLTIGTRSGGSGQWWQEGNEFFDLAGREVYEAQGHPINITGQIDKDETHPLTYSYHNYHTQVNRLWNSFEKPAIIPESGWDHTFYEMSMPGYLAQYHNAMWICLASGTAMSPTWWAYGGRINDNIVNNQILNHRRFTNQIPFSKLTGIAPVEIKNSEGNAYAMGSDQLIFGWAVNADTDISGKTITLPEIAKGKYSLKLYHTWRGRFLENEDGDTEQIVESKGKSVSFNIPILKVEQGHARYIGQDIAFILTPQK